ncbi:hypothetical protein EVAR_54259_1 [Eumeta japonica]|uniref:Mitogen-activated protein kinase kinase kinase N-terminal domain-containing protein n=1 Tax=Eumeta variegata TaxID=151549 RepID=A0A4C1YKI6_EUMVA|nr:hypothetical protein EVAR_54259_1 [Eumeta japonica]
MSTKKISLVEIRLSRLADDKSRGPSSASPIGIREASRNSMDPDAPMGRMLRAGRWQTMDNMYQPENHMPSPPDRTKRRSLIKTLTRGRERDMKIDLSKDHRADSLPSPNLQPPIPTLVESCNRFMSLTSRLKCREKLAAQAAREMQVERNQQQQEREQAVDETVPQKRVSFHKTFSMLIKMGNIDKTCRRAISLEEQVWQNELKDLIWLELQAKIAGRTPPQQDAFLCAQRDIVPTIIQNIINYRFVNPSPCSQRPDVEHSEDEVDGQDQYSYLLLGCLSLNCLSCSDAIGKALREVGTLLDSFYNAETLYPSSKAMANHHPLIATQLFNNRLKAMCLWYNIALHMRMKIMAVQRLVVSIKAKASARQGYSRRLTSSESETSRGNDTPRVSTVRFNIDGDNQPENRNPSDSNNSDSSSNSELSQQKAIAEVENQNPPENCTQNISEIDNQCPREEDIRNEIVAPSTPEIHINDMENRNNGTVDTTTSTESGYLSDKSSLPFKEFWTKLEENPYNVYNMGPLEEVVRLKLLCKCSVSPYRQYHYEILKTQGVRKCMMFVHKMNKKILNKVYLTLEKENSLQSQQYKDNEPEEVFEDTKDETERQDSKEMIELRRYGCWSEETLQMRLPSYRNHFLLLTTICLETVHDYLSLRLETQPSKPSCLTVKQLIHELKEGLDIATEMRSAFVRNIDAALADYPADAPIEADLVAVIRTFDETVENVLKQYLSYLTTMSEVEHMPRSCLETEWGFTARLAKRMRCAAELGPLSFSDIVCNQMDRLIKQFTEKFARLTTYEDNIPDDDSDEAKRHFVYALCRQAQDIYASERELTIQTVQFSRLLATRLKKNNRFVRCRERIFKSLMRIRDCIVLHADKIAEKTAIAPWEDINPETAEGLFSRIRELLMQVYKLSFEVNLKLRHDWARFQLHKELHRFVYTAPQEGARAARARPASLQPQRARPPRPVRRRPETIVVNETFNALIEAKLVSGNPSRATAATGAVVW